MRNKYLAEHLKIYGNDPKPTHGKYRNVPFILHYFILHDGPKRDMTAMQHYNAYIKIPWKHPFRRYMHPKKQKWSIFSSRHVEKSINTSKLPYFPVHGGITFAHLIKKTDEPKWLAGFTKGPWIGWDYGHAGDQLWHLPTLKWQLPDIYAIEMDLKRDVEKIGGPGAYERDHKVWKPEEVLVDIFDAIDELLRIKK
jgi:hypothetical protein